MEVLTKEQALTQLNEIIESNENYRSNRDEIQADNQSNITEAIKDWATDFVDFNFWLSENKRNKNYFQVADLLCVVDDQKFCYLESYWAPNNDDEF